jgi:hypothetical protein
MQARSRRPAQQGRRRSGSWAPSQRPGRACRSTRSRPGRVDVMGGHQFGYYARLLASPGWTRIVVIGRRSVGDGGADIATDPPRSKSLSSVFAGMVLRLARPVDVGDQVLIRSGASGGELRRNRHRDRRHLRPPRHRRRAAAPAQLPGSRGSDSTGPPQRAEADPPQSAQRTQPAARQTRLATTAENEPPWHRSDNRPRLARPAKNPHREVAPGGASRFPQPPDLPTPPPSLV